MKRIIIAIAVTISLLTGCTISQSYHFNKDFSGTAETSIEMGELITFIKSMDTSGNGNSMDTLDKSFKEVADKLTEAGAKNVNYGWKDDQTTLFVKYDFANIDDLNNLIKNSSNQSLNSLTFSGNPDDVIKFTKKGKRKLIYDAPEVDNDTLKDNEQIAAMKDYIKYEINFSFENEIKKYTNKNAVLSSDKKTVIMNGNIMDILADDYTSDITFKIKR